MKKPAAILPNSDVQKARNQSIVDVWQRLGLPEAEEGKAFCSPFREDKKPSAELGGGKNIFYDHTTRESLDSIALVSKVKGLQLPDAVRFIIGGGDNDNPAKRRDFSFPRPKASSKPKVWSDKDMAEREFSKLPFATDTPAAVTLLAGDYGIPKEAIPEDWRVFKLNGKPGLVYPRLDHHHVRVSFKWKSIERDRGGKRRNQYIFGAGGALILPSNDPFSPVVVVGGEEKAAAALAAELQALAPLTGEKALSQKWLETLCSYPDNLILANDHDDAGRQANAETAKALEEAGFPPERIRVLAYPARHTCARRPKRFAQAARPQETSLHLGVCSAL